MKRTAILKMSESSPLYFIGYWDFIRNVRLDFRYVILYKFLKEDTRYSTKKNNVKKEGKR